MKKSKHLTTENTQQLKSYEEEHSSWEEWSHHMLTMGTTMIHGTHHDQAMVASGVLLSCFSLDASCCIVLTRSI